ncbi:nucleotidyltransferase domain-containing protein [Arenicella sp. 4NH20-0111]|uniref:nucleotidyltransferase domain-containing protein n=1 Tax=Arenicella sp. 4NH20-0111 TaxID=3127648 RepID=UPI003105C5C5
MEIDSDIFSDVQKHLTEIEKEHSVVILQAIESGSRAWGFPSPDSDYDVRFIYAHPKDWYLQLSEERDVIELPINDELDIAGWDLRKALNLANKGNAVVQEWMVSPIVYRQSVSHTRLSSLIEKAFSPIAAYHHYRSMAKKAFADIEQSEQKKLKRFFYFARATLSAKWIIERQTMPSIVFSELVEGLIDDVDMVDDIAQLIERKGLELEKSLLEVPPKIYGLLSSIFQSLEDQVNVSTNPKLVSNEDFRAFVSHYC